MEAWFYLYFASESAANEAAKALSGEGYEVEIRMGADDVNWLTLASRPVDDEGIDEVEHRMGLLASSLGGEYDGYERT